MANNRQALHPERIYHLYHHAVGDENYRYFLQCYSKYIFPIADIFCYCLLPKHYHFLIRIRSREEILSYLDPKKLKREKWNAENKSLSTLLANEVGRFQNAYAKAFNKMYSRKGSLFRQSFGRKEVSTDSYFTSAIHYIHANAVHHGFVKDALDWKYSSYHAYLSSKPSRLLRQEVIDWFGGREQFTLDHKKDIDERLTLEMEDF